MSPSTKFANLTYSSYFQSIPFIFVIFNSI